MFDFVGFRLWFFLPLFLVDVLFTFFVSFLSLLWFSHMFSLLFVCLFIVWKQKRKSDYKNLATINGHSYSTLNNMVIGPVPSSCSSPSLPITLDNSSCTPTPNPSVTTSSNAGDGEDGSTTTTTQSATALNNNNNAIHNNNLSSHHSHHAQSQSQHDHHHQHHQQPTDSPSDQSSLIILQPSGELSASSATGLGAYSPMLPSFGHYAPGKCLHTNTQPHRFECWVVSIRFILYFLFFLVWLSFFFICFFIIIYTISSFFLPFYLSLRTESGSTDDLLAQNPYNAITSAHIFRAQQKSTHAYWK